MNAINETQLLDALQWRYATKKFDPARRIPAAAWSALEQSLVLAPSSFGIQPWKFVVIETPAVREQLKAVSWGQSQVTDASHYVVFLLRKGVDEPHIDRYMARTAEVRGVTVESLAPFKKVILQSLAGATKAGTLDAWQARQVYLAVGQFMTSAALLGVDTCAIEGMEPAKYDDLLGLAGAGYTTLCAVAAGYRAADDKYAATPKVRFAAADVIERR